MSMSLRRAPRCASHLGEAEVRARLVGLGAEWRAGVHAGYRASALAVRGPRAVRVPNPIPNTIPNHIPEG